jgi:hypothetical protein
MLCPKSVNGFAQATDPRVFVYDDDIYAIKSVSLLIGFEFRF